MPIKKNKTIYFHDLEKISSNWKDVFCCGNQKNFKRLQLYNFTVAREGRELS
jgi:hypothetical protein